MAVYTYEHPRLGLLRSRRDGSDIAEEEEEEEDDDDDEGNAKQGFDMWAAMAAT